MRSVLLLLQPPSDSPFSTAEQGTKTLLFTRRRKRAVQFHKLSASGAIVAARCDGRQLDEHIP